MKERTIRIDNKYFEQIKALAAVPGGSMIDAANEIVGAGLGDLREIEDEAVIAIKGKVPVKRSKVESVAIDNDPITITEAERKEPKAKKQAVKEDEVSYECADCGSEITTDMERCPDCDNKLNWNAIGEDGNPGSDTGWIWAVGILVSALALRRKLVSSNDTSAVMQ